MFPVLAGNSASTGYNLTRSLRFRASASAYLNRTPASTSNQKTWTWSGWVKRGALGQSGGSTPYFFVSSSAGTDAAFFACGFNGDALTVTGYATNYLTTSAVYRDPAAWYHVVIAVDTTQATTSNRIKVYVNGSQVTAFSTANYVAQNFNTPVNLNQAHYHCAFNVGSGVQNFNDLYLEEINFVDGQQLTPSSFGSTNALTGVWQPARYAGTYGTNGFYLPFTDNSALTTSSNVGLGKDFSGNGNYWTTNNISITAGVTYDSMTDVPTLTSATAANFAVLNPLMAWVTTAVNTLSNGNLRCVSGIYTAPTIGTIQLPTTGKYYWEITVGTQVSELSIGINAGPFNPSTGNYSTRTAYYRAGGASNSIFIEGTVNAFAAASYTVGDVIGVAYDATTPAITWYKNNSSQGTYTLTSTANLFPYLVQSAGSGQFDAYANFGQRPFSYTPPTGFVALNTFNLPTSTIVKGNTVMDATLWTGNGTTQNIVNAAGFKPDMVWVKNRGRAFSNVIEDSVRGATKVLATDQTAAEATDVNSITSFNSNGFSVGSGPTYNDTGYGLVGWQWQAGQGSTSSNTNGTITSTVSVNASAGFSVVTYTGTGANATVGHGLGVAPQFIIVKQRSGTLTWRVYFVSIGNGNVLYLSATDASTAEATAWNSTTPTSSVFSVGTSNGTNQSAATYVAYCWTPIAGYSAFGSYTGNGSADGPFVYTGFRPRWIMIKRSDSAGNNWRIWDTARATYNAGLLALFPNVSDAEDSVTDTYDLVSNGFKLRTSGVGTNASGGTYVYAAFAENPFKNSLAR